MLFADRVGPHFGVGWNEVLAGNLGDGAGSVVEQAVVHAAEILPFAAAQGERGQAVDAAVLQGGEGVFGVSPDDDRVAEDRDTYLLIDFEVLRPAGYVPGVFDVEHGLPSVI